jgi:hypothetical protein
MQTQESVTQKQTFSERPGQPDCPYFLKTGECRFGVTCQYHHPKERFEKSSESMFNPSGPPLHYVSDFVQDLMSALFSISKIRILNLELLLL